MIIDKKEKLFIDLIDVIPDKIHTRFTNKIYPLNVALAGEKVLISKTKEKHGYTYMEKWLEVPKNHVCIWYSWTCGKNQHSKENKGVRFKYIILPRFIPLDQLALISLGLLEAEMETSIKYSCSVSFDNCEPVLINYIMMFFARLGIPYFQWH